MEKRCVSLLGARAQRTKKKSEDCDLQERHGSRVTKKVLEEYLIKGTNTTPGVSEKSSQGIAAE